MLTGKSGAIGPNARPLVARGQESGAAPAVNLSLEAMTSVMEIRPKWKIAEHPSVQVIPCVSYFLIHF